MGELAKLSRAVYTIAESFFPFQYLSAAMPWRRKLLYLSNHFPSLFEEDGLENKENEIVRRLGSIRLF